MDRVKEVFDVCFTHRVEGKTKLRSIEGTNLTEEVYFPLARLMLYYADVDFVRDAIFDLIPPEYHDDKRYLALENLLCSLEDARTYDTSVFPLNVPFRNRWKGPHLAFPKELNGKLFHEWYPLRVELAEGDTIYCTVAENDPQLRYGTIQFTKDQFEKWLVDATLDEMQLDREKVPRRPFFEIAFYGDEPQIRMHKEEKWDDPDLPPLRTDLIEEVHKKLEETWPGCIRDEPSR